MSYLIRNPGSSHSKVYNLVLGSNTIGRGERNSISLGEAEKSVSRHHAVITITPESVKVIDQGSLNSTYVNDIKVTESNLQDGDLIQFGDVVFQFVHTLPSAQPTLEGGEGLPSFRRVSVDATQVAMQDLLQQEDYNSNSVLRLRNQDANQRSVDKLQLLLEMSKQLSEPEDFDQLLQKILNVLFQIMNIDRAVILLMNEVSHQLEPKAVRSRLQIPTDYQFFSKRIAEFVVQQGVPVLVDDAQSDERFDSSESIVSQSIHAAICVPLRSRATVLGVLYVDNLSLGSLYSKEDVEFLTALAYQAAIAIENARLYKQIQEEAILLDRLERFFPKAISQKIKETEILEIIDTEVTALFVDITGFTEMSSSMEPRQVILMLNEYFKVMVEEIVFPYEGTLEKYIGDALLAIWGAPYQRPDDVHRATQAAIEMQRAVCRLNDCWKHERNLEIQVHIGLNTGKVAAGNIGSDKLIQYATIGDTTNVTSRICTVAQAGEILISQTTFDKLKGQDLPVEPIAPVRVKGKEEPLQLYKVLWQHVKSDLF